MIMAKKVVRRKAVPARDPSGSGSPPRSKQPVRRDKPTAAPAASKAASAQPTKFPIRRSFK